MWELAATVMDPRVNGNLDITKKFKMAKEARIDNAEIKLGLAYTRWVEKYGADGDLLDLVIPKKKYGVIFTLTLPRQYEDGMNAANEEAMAGLEEYLNTGMVDRVDVELDTKPDYLKRTVKMIKKYGAEAIVSWHDYTGTPARRVMDEVYEKELKVGADMAKLCPRNSDFDEGKLTLRCALDYSAKSKIVMWGMGPVGRITRILTPGKVSFGNWEGASAEGQMNIQEMLKWRDTFVSDHDSYHHLLYALTQ